MTLIFSKVNAIPIKVLKDAAEVFFEVSNFEELIAHAKHWDAELILFDEKKYYFHTKTNNLYFFCQDGTYPHKLIGGDENG